MRWFALAALAMTAFAWITMIDPTDANAAVCVRGVYRAGCVTTGGAVVVRRPHACHYVVVNGVRVRRCV